MRPSPWREVAARALGLLRRPAIGLCALGIGGGAALTRLPLFEVPGYELACAMAILVSLFGGAIGVAAGRQERNLIVGLDPRPAGATRLDTPLAAVLAAAAAAALINLALLLPPLLTAIVAGALGSRCDVLRGLPFYAALPVPSALLAATLGVGCGLLSLRRRWSAVAYGLAVVAAAAATAWPILFGPPVVAFNAFAGYFPGPIYDERLAVTPALVTYRGVTLLWAIAAAAATACLLDPRRGMIRGPHLRPGSWVLLALAAAGIASAHTHAFELGFRTSTSDLAQALGGRRVSRHFQIHYPAGKPRAEVERLERDLEFRYAQLAAFFGAEPAGTVTAYLYRSPEEKQRRVGAAETNYAKPWRREFHVTDAAFPHPAIRHELAHVFAGAFGSPGFGVSARGGVLVSAGIVEGVATAADNPTDELTLHEWAKAMRELKLAPDVRSIVGPAGFYAESHARAYAIAGSFLRHLADTYGPAKLRALYPRGDFAVAYGKALDELAAEWERTLDQIPIDERTRHQAEVRFERGSLFTRPCAREVASLSEEARQIAPSDPDRAVALYRRCAEIEPRVAAHRRGEADALLRKRDLAGATGVLEKLIADPDAAPAGRAGALMTLGDVAWERGDRVAARKRFEEVLGLHRDRGTDRMATAKLASLDDPALSSAVFSVLVRGPTPGSLLRLRELNQARPSWGLGWYLLGRQLHLQRDHRRALPYLERAAKSPLPSEEFVVENLRILAISRYFAGDCAGLEAAFAELVARAPTAAFRRTAQDWKERCAFEKAGYGGVLADED